MARIGVTLAAAMLCVMELGSGARQASATVVTYDFAGVLNSAGGTGSWSAVTSGDTFTGWFSFDDAVTGTVNPVTAVYQTGIMQLTVEGITFQIGATFDDRRISVSHGDIASPDLWSLINSDGPSGTSAATANGSVIDSLIQSLTFRTDQDSDVFPDFGSPLLTTSSLFLQASDFDETLRTFRATASGTGYLTRLTERTGVVPVPGALPLLATGLVALAGLGRLRRSARGQIRNA